MKKKNSLKSCIVVTHGFLIVIPRSSKFILLNLSAQVALCLFLFIRGNSQFTILSKININKCIITRENKQY